MEMESFLLNADCREHSGGVLKYYCEDHDMPVCDACCHTEHNTCIKKVDLNTISHGIKEHQQYKITQTSLNNIKDDLEKLKVTRKDDNTRIDEEKCQIRHKMQDTATKIKNKVDNLLKRSDNELETKFHEFKQNIEHDVNALEATLAQVNQSIDGLQKDNEKEVFVEMKTNKQIQQEAKKTIKKISGNVNRESLNFTFDPIFENLASKRKFGKLTFENTKHTAKQRLFHESCEYDITLQGTYDVNINKDSVSCHILDSCLLIDGTMVLTDLPHNLVIHIDTTYKVITTCNVSGEPWGVCSTTSTEVAVTLIGQQMVQLISIGKTMEMKNSFKVGMPCRGIVYKDGNVYICCGGGSSYWKSVMEGCPQIRVYTLQGVHLNTFENDVSGKLMFGRPRDIALNIENNLFYITDVKKGIVVINKSGEKVDTITDKNLIAARGITFDSRGQIFVGCLKSNQVLLFDQDGQILHIPITKCVAVSSIRSLCFIAESYRLVATNHSNSIHVFDLARRY